MGNRYLTSPAGEDIEVLGDNEMAERLGGVDAASLRQMLRWSPVRPPIVRALWHHGAYEDRKSGRAAWMLAADAGLDGSSVVSPVLGSPALRPCIVREGNGKRTFLIRLVALPERWVGFVENGS